MVLFMINYQSWVQNYAFLPVEEIENGTAKKTPQNDEESCYAKMLTKQLGNIDWNTDAAAIERLIRGLNPWPSAYTFYNEKCLKYGMHSW